MLGKISRACSRTMQIAQMALITAWVRSEHTGAANSEATGTRSGAGSTLCGAFGAGEVTINVNCHIGNDILIGKHHL